jgi:glycosyltransferase involved in cell wall biosynthesis
MPAYKAEGFLEATVDRVPPAIWDRTRVFWIVDDGSPDGTRAVADRVAERHSVVRVRSFEANRGYGGAVLEGLQRVGAEPVKYAVCLHADGQYAPESLPDLLSAMEERGLDLCQGSRHAAGTARAGGMPVYKVVAGKILTTMENLTFGLKMTDYHSGMLGYGRRLLDTVHFDRLSGSFDFDLEVIAAARTAGLAIGEIPIPTHYGDEESHLNPISYGLRCLRVMGRYATGRYRTCVREE